MENLHLREPWITSYTNQMIITIQQLGSGFQVNMIDTYAVPDISQFDLMKDIGIFSDSLFEMTGERPTVKMLPIQNNSMATKKKVVAKKKKAVKKVVKK